MKKDKISCLRISLLNVIGLILSLYISYTTAWEPEELREIPGSVGGGALIWVLETLPLLGIFIFLNIGWLLSIVFKSKTNKDNCDLKVWIVFIVFIVFIVLWFICIRYSDFIIDGVLAMYDALGDITK